MNERALPAEGQQFLEIAQRHDLLNREQAERLEAIVLEREVDHLHIIDDAPEDTNVVAFPGAGTAAANEDQRRWPLAVAASLVAAVAVALVTQPVGQQSSGLPGNDALVSASLDTLTSASGLGGSCCISTTRATVGTPATNITGDISP